MNEIYAIDAMPSKRWKDPATGYLHIKDNKLTRAQVDGYYGKEIMGSQNAGLEPDKLYQVFRPLPEILKGAQVFSGSPVMEEHPEGDVNAETLAEAKEAYWARDKIPVGSVFNIRDDGEYLLGDIVIYNKDSIDAIERGEKKQLSCGYAYKPFVESGLYEGKPYDIVMKNIKYNHIALVAKGRVGPEVKVSDEAPNIRKVEKIYPSKKLENNGKNNTAGKKPSDQAAGKKFWDTLGGKLMNEKGKGSDTFGSGPGRDIVLARRILELEKAMSTPKDIEWAKKVIQSAKARMNDPIVKKLMTEPVKQFDSAEGGGMAIMKGTENSVLEGEENGAIQQIREGVENFENIHEREGYLPPEGLDEIPQGSEAGTPELGAPNPAQPVEDEFPPEGKSKANDGPKYEAAKKRMMALQARADQLKKEFMSAQAAWEKAKQAANDFNGALAKMNINDESPEGTIPVGEGSDEFPEPNNGCEFKGVAMDGKKMFDRISRALDEKYRRRDQALDEVRPLVGQLKFTAAANDAAVYTYALKQKGIEPPKNINVEGLRGMVQALLASINRNASALSAATAFDAAPKAKSDEYEKLLDSAKTRVL